MEAGPQPHRLLGTPGTGAHSAPLSVQFFSQEYWNGLPSLCPVALLDSGIEPGSPELKANSLPSQPPGKPLREQRRV